MAIEERVSCRVIQARIHHGENAERLGRDEVLHQLFIPEDRLPMRVDLVFAQAVSEWLGQGVRLLRINDHRKSVVSLRKRGCNAAFSTEVEVQRIPQPKFILITVVCLGQQLIAQYLLTTVT